MKHYTVNLSGVVTFEPERQSWPMKIQTYAHVIVRVPVLSTWASNLPPILIAYIKM